MTVATSTGRPSQSVSQSLVYCCTPTFYHASECRHWCFLRSRRRSL